MKSTSYGNIMALPSEFCEHMVERFDEYHTILDACVGIGTFSIALAKAGHKIIGTEINYEYYQQALQNARKAKVDILVLNGDVLNDSVLQPSLMINAAFLDPDWNRDHTTKPPIVRFDAMRPSLFLLLAKIHKMTENIVIRLPKETDLSQLKYLLDDYYYEIEDCFLNDRLLFYLIYLGGLACHSEYRCKSKQ